MTKPLPEKFEDWTPPWGEGEIDADKVSRLLFNALSAEQSLTAEKKTLRGELSKLTTENQELADANEVFKKASDKAKEEHSTDVQKAVAEAEEKVKQAEKKVEAANAKVAEKARENDLLQVRVKFPKIDDEDIDRLRGDDLDALLEDAEKFAEKHGLVAKEDEEQLDDDADRWDGDNPLTRQPRSARTPGDPRPAAPAVSGVDELLKRRQGANLWG